MPTDREILKVIATKVMGWTWSEAFRDNVEIRRPGQSELNYWDGDTSHTHPTYWNPLVKWADAGMVLEALATRSGYAVGMQVFPNKIAAASLLSEDYEVEREAATGPRAISLAAYEFAIQADSAKDGGKP